MFAYTKKHLRRTSSKRVGFCLLDSEGRIQSVSGRSRNNCSMCSVSESEIKVLKI